MRKPGEWQQVVLAQRIDRYVFDDDHLVVGLGRNHVDQLARVLVQSGANLFVHKSDASWSALEPWTARVLAYSLEYEPDTGFDFGQIDSGRRSARQVFWNRRIVFLGIRHRAGLVIPCGIF